VVPGLSEDYRRDRRRMVDALRREGIQDLAVLHAFDVVPRHLFVPEALRHRAYALCPLPIGEGQTISSPVIHGLSLELARIEEGARVLEVGTGSGFQTGLLAALGAQVYSVERLDSLSRRAGDTLDALGIEAALRVGDGSEGWPEHAPYDAIIVGAAAARVPGALLAQLANGGRLIVPVGEGLQTLYRIMRRGNEFDRERITGARFVPLIQEDVAPSTGHGRGGDPSKADGQ